MSCGMGAGRIIFSPGPVNLPICAHDTPQMGKLPFAGVTAMTT
jgi:hypothetical protein